MLNIFIIIRVIMSVTAINVIYNFKQSVSKKIKKIIILFKLRASEHMNKK